MSQSKFIKAGSILSEFQIYKVKSVNQSNRTVDVTDSNNNVIELPFKYVDDILTSADYFEKTVKKTVTELAALVINNPRVAMTVGFTKKGKELSDTAYRKKIAEAVAKVKDAKVSEIDALVTNMMTNPIRKSEEGEFRHMKGTSAGTLNDLGRINFFDAEAPASIVKQVDPRTIDYVILNKVRYEHK